MCVLSDVRWLAVGLGVRRVLHVRVGCVLGAWMVPVHGGFAGALRGVG